MFSAVSVRSSSAALAVYTSRGKGDVVLLLHGGPGCPDYLGPVAALLPNMRTVRFDQRGVGGSQATSGTYAVEDYLDDIEAVRCQLGIECWHVLGHSWGGLLAQLYTAAHAGRVLSLFLCNSALGVGRDWRRTRQEVVRHNRSALGAAGFVELAACQLAAGMPGPAGQLAAQRVFALVHRGYFVGTEPPQVPAAHLGKVSARAARATGRALLRHPEDALARDDATRPTIVVYGDHDIFGRAGEVVLNRFPSARHCILDDCGHVPWLQVPDRFSEIVRTFYGDPPEHRFRSRT